MKSPAFQFYPADWLGSQRVQLLSLEEEGAYLRLLCYCWLHGSIPSDESLAVKLLGKGGLNVDITTVLAMFQPASNPGRLMHERLEAERRKQSDWREKSSIGGRKSAEKRAGKSEDKEGCLKNGANHSSTLQSSVFSLHKDVGRTAVRPAVDDESWLDQISKSVAYQGIDVRVEYGKCGEWCGVNKKILTRRRFINWLNRADRPMQRGQKKPQPLHEPENWRQILHTNHSDNPLLIEIVERSSDWSDFSRNTQEMVVRAVGAVPDEARRLG